MSIFLNNIKKLIVASSVVPFLLISCETAPTSMVVKSCPAVPSFAERMTKKYGHKDVFNMVIEADKYSKQEDLKSALTTIEDGLALSNINAFGRSVLYRIKGQVYVRAGDNEAGIKALETAIAQGGFKAIEAEHVSKTITNIKTLGKMTEGDIDAAPLVRVPPIFPQRVNESGHCRVMFDVTEKGVPANVKTTYCTNPLLQRPTVNSVKLWKYTPKIADGIAVMRQGVTSKVTFRLTDECGIIIPEPS